MSNIPELSPNNSLLSKIQDKLQGVNTKKETTN